MKLSANTIGAALFTVAGIALFVLMAKRMPEEGADTSAMNFGMPLSGVAEQKAPEPVTPEEALKTIETTTPVISDPVASEEAPVSPEVESVKAEVEAQVEDTAATMPATTTSETSMAEPTAEPTEKKVEEVPAPTPVDVPAVEGSMPAN